MSYRATPPMSYRFSTTGLWHPEFHGNFVIYGTGGGTSHESESSETREITLPRTSDDLLDQNLPVAELTAAQTRRCRTLKKQMQMSCKVIDMNTHFVEQTLTRRGGLGILRLCEEAITDSFQSLQKAAHEFTDILRYTESEVVELSVIELVSDAQDCVDSVLVTLDDILESVRDWKEASGSDDDITHGPLLSKPRREDQSGTLDGPPHRRDDPQSLPPGRREGPLPGLLDDRQSLPPSRPGHFEINDGDGDATPLRHDAVPSTPEAGGDQIRRESARSMDEDETKEKGPPAGLDDSHDDVNADVPPAGRAKLKSHILIERDCGQDEVDRCEWPYVRDVQQQECGKELDELTALRYLSGGQSGGHRRPARGRRR